MVGIDPASDGLARARRLGVADDGRRCRRPDRPARLRRDRDRLRRHLGRGARGQRRARSRPTASRMIDLTPAAIGPFVVPAVNLEQHLDAPELNMVTCGGQATIPIVAAVSRVTPVPYAEIVASIASRSAGPGTRANIDEFTETTASAIESVGGARAGQGDHHPQPGRAADDHARHGVLPGRRARAGRPAGDRELDRADGRRGVPVRARLPAQAGGADHRRPRPAVPPSSASSR